MTGRTKALFDVSVLVDALRNEDQLEQESATALRLAAKGEIQGYLCATALDSLNDCLVRTHGNPNARRKLRELRDALVVATVDANVIDGAMALGWQYLDDAVTYECARANGLDAVLTLNPSDFASSALSVLAPAEFLQRRSA